MNKRRRFKAKRIRKQGGVRGGPARVRNWLAHQPSIWVRVGELIAVSDGPYHPPQRGVIWT